MPYRRRVSYGRRRSYPRSIVNSTTNRLNNSGATVNATNTETVIVLAKDAPLQTNGNEVQRACLIKAVWFSIDACGTSSTGVNNQVSAFMMKNPGANLTPPLAGTEGTSNEKKFIFKSWQGMVMRNQDGNAPLHWEGWLPIPKKYQRFGQDDTLVYEIRNPIGGSTGHFTCQFIYKWYT